MKCNKCGIDKPIEEFYNGRRACKGCMKEWHKEYYKNNAEQIKEYAKEYRKEYAKKNKDYIKEQKKEWYKENAERIKEHKKEWRKKNAEHIKEQKKEYNKEYSKNLSDGYIKQELKHQGYPPNQITPLLIKIKRVQIQIHRELSINN